MLSKSTLLHLRIPFSFYLLPVFCFAVSLSPHVELWRILAVFFILHFLLYPASNGYNSYFDKDEDSIGGLENPPPVDKQLLYVSLALDGFALVAGIFLGWEFVAALFLYGLVSKAYSDERIRLKRYPFISWILASVFQGAFTFLAVYQAVNNVPLSALLQPVVYLPALLTTMLLGGSYPMTQVYQHEEDARRGDMTMSRLLGIYGTFWFTTLVFLVTVLGFYVYFQTYHTVFHFWLFILCLSPGLVFFLWWFWQVYKNKNAANFKFTMRLNLLTATGMNIFFILFGWLIRN
jgi:1,4-dihydroxy-2-naphthoate octaprenyltransferase